MRIAVNGRELQDPKNGNSPKDDGDWGEVRHAHIHKAIYSYLMLELVFLKICSILLAGLRVAVEKCECTFKLLASMLIYPISCVLVCFCFSFLFILHKYFKLFYDIICFKNLNICKYLFYVIVLMKALAETSIVVLV